MDSLNHSQHRSQAVELFLVSFVALFIELLFIRWMSADIRAFSTFKTFPLVACFIGLGVGCSRGNDKLFPWSLPLIFLSAVTIKFLLPMTHLSELVLGNMASYNWEIHSPEDLSAWLQSTTAFMAFLLTVLALPFFTMMSLGSRIGVLFNQFDPLNAYCIDILGAICGSAIFSVASFYFLPPSILMILALVILLCFTFKKARVWWLPTIAAAAALVICVAPRKDLPPATESFWSPYQHLALQKYTANPTAPPQDWQNFFYLSVNGRPYQSCWDPRLQSHPLFMGFAVPYWSRCYMPYTLGKKADDVLIVAAGMGMDVYAALQAHASYIDAVDIDPLIMSLGKALNPCRPYQSPAVHPVCDDARHFFRTTPRQYDMVVFSHLDSQTVLGEGSSVRLDNFVYTKESFQQALKLLKKDGLLFVCFNAKKDWFRDRIFWTMTEAAGYPPIAFKDPADTGNWSFFLISGPAVRDGKIKLPEALRRIDSQIAPRAQVRILTDDWPYLYVQTLRIDWTYLIISLEILLVAAIAGRKFLVADRSPSSWQLFFLGAGFILLELQSISRLALLYGTTWITSSVVINGVLIMILLANSAVIKWKPAMTSGIKLLYGLLFAALMASYLLPVGVILQQLPGPAGAALVTLVTLLPILMAGLIFPVSFALSKNSAVALAFNLCGAMLGALLEYQANFSGINSLVLMSTALYVISFIFLLRAKPSTGQKAA